MKLLVAYFTVSANMNLEGVVMSRYNLTAEQKKRIIELLKTTGLLKKVIAKRVGVSESTVLKINNESNARPKGSGNRTDIDSFWG